MDASNPEQIDQFMAGGCRVWAGSGSKLLVLIELELSRPLSLEPGGPVQTTRVQGLGLGLARSLYFSLDGVLTGCFQS